MIYLDSASKSKIYPEVKEFIKENLDICSNPSSLHKYGIQARKMVETAREQFATTINCRPENIIFCANASMANAIALNQSKYCVTSVYEHESISSHPNVISKHYEINNVLDSKRALIDSCGVVSWMLANNEIGTIFDIKLLTNEKTFIVHSDMTAAYGNINIDVQDLGVDTASFSSSKFGGIGGCGILYYSNDLPKIKPIVYGTQENGFNGGTENFLGIIATGLAAEITHKNLQENIMKKQIIKDMITFELANSGLDYKVCGDYVGDLPSVLSIAFKNIEGDGLMNYLSENDIFVSTGSACHSGNLEKSPTIKSLNLPADYINGIIRISIAPDTNLGEIKEFIKYIKKYYELIGE